MKGVNTMKNRAEKMTCLMCGKPGVAARGRDDAPLYFDCPHCRARLTVMPDDQGDYPSAAKQIAMYRRAVNRLGEG